MANKIISLSDSNGSSNAGDPLEVYRDISIVSEQKIDYDMVESGGRYHRVSNSRYHMAKDVNVKAVFNSIRNIFSWIQGERILNPDFGSRLRFYLYEGITPENKEQIAAEVRGVCLKWEPRVNIVKVVPVDSAADAEDNTVRLDITFTIPSLSNEQYRYSYTYNRTQ